jgi:hypothetical protein
MNFAFDCGMRDYGWSGDGLARWGGWVLTIDHRLLTIDHRPSTGRVHPEVGFQVGGDWLFLWISLRGCLSNYFISLLLEQSLNLASSKMNAFRVFILQYALVAESSCALVELRRTGW